MRTLKNPAAIRHIRAELLLRSQLDFTRYFFRQREGIDFIEAPFHSVLCSTLDAVMDGRIQRLIINIPPGYGKTENAVVNFVARGFAKNPRARFIHLSYGDKLALDNSSKTRELIKSEAFQELWEREFKEDSDTKGLWKTEEGGGFLAGPAGGVVTGFRAGTMDEGFTGALIIDDPVKPDDARHYAALEHINSRWHTTFKSRLALERVPVIVIMQRLHVEDFAGFLLGGGAGCKWHHLILPVEINAATPYPAEYTHGIPIPHNLPDGPLWLTKHTPADIETLKLDAFTFAGQYDQRPTPAGGVIFKSDYMGQRYRELPDMLWRGIWGDTAQKTGERNDYTVLQCWGKARVGGKAHLIDQVRAKLEAPELEKTALAFWNKHNDKSAFPHNRFGVLRSMRIEDKVSGTGLIQSLRRVNIPIFGIPRDKDKYTRALDAVPHYAAGNVVLPVPEIAPWIVGWQTEHTRFTGKGDTHDDQVDPSIDAVLEICGANRSMLEAL